MPVFKEAPALRRGENVMCKDDNRLNTDPSNWELIPRGALPFMNGHRGPDYQAAAPEVKPVILTMANLRHARSVRAKDNRKERKKEQ